MRKECTCRSQKKTKIFFVNFWQNYGKSSQYEPWISIALLKRYKWMTEWRNKWIRSKKKKGSIKSLIVVRTVLRLLVIFLHQVVAPVLCPPVSCVRRIWDDDRPTTQRRRNINELIIWRFVVCVLFKYFCALLFCTFTYYYNYLCKNLFFCVCEYISSMHVFWFYLNETLKAKKAIKTV